MPRSKREKAAVETRLVDLPAPDMVDSVPVPVLEKRIAEIRRCKQVQGDANTDHAEAWKDLERAGVASNQGWKWAIKLEGMEAPKRAAVLRSFDEARRFLNLDAQMELSFGDAPVSEVAPAEAGHDASSVTSADTRSRDFPPGDDATPEEGSCWQPSEVRDDDPALDAGGKHYGDGRNAGLDGQALGDNPHGVGTVAAGLWEAGWREGSRLHGAAALGSDRPAFPEAAAQA